MKLQYLLEFVRAMYCDLVDWFISIEADAMIESLEDDD